MPKYRRRTRISAPLDTVWDFHSRISGLRALTPDWMGLKIDSIRGPDGESDPTVLREGTEISMSARPFGVGPRVRWISRIVERREGDGYRMFKDDMLGGPFELWVHTHEFYGDGPETVVIDTVEYELPFGRVGDALERFGEFGFEPMFRSRHRKTKALLEEGARRPPRGPAVRNGPMER